MGQKSGLGFIDTEASHIKIVENIVCPNNIIQSRRVFNTNRRGKKDGTLKITNQKDSIGRKISKEDQEDAAGYMERKTAEINVVGTKKESCARKSPWSAIAMHQKSQVG